MSDYRSGYAALRILNKVAFLFAAASYGITYGLARLFGRPFANFVSANLHTRSTVPVEKLGVKFVCNNSDYVMRTRFAYLKERETLEWIDAFPEDSVLWDIGANIGSFALYAGIRGHRVIAFEPLPANFAALSLNINKNRLEDRVIALNLALYRDTKVAHLHSVDMRAGSAMSVFDRPVEDAHQTLRTKYRFSTISMKPEQVVSDLGVLPPDFIKLDVDGNEFDILEAAEAILSAPSLKGMLIEMCDAQADYQPINELLERHGFRVKERHRHGEFENVVFERAHPSAA